jgi:site-specific DNA-adenine methylase
MMPPHETYIETHLGGGAIMKRKPPALENIGIDIDPRALSRFDCGYPVRLVNGCAHEFLRRYEFGGAELVYSDPPYLMRTRTSGRRYRYDYEERDHVELLELLKSLPCGVIISGYASALYEELLKGWFNFVVDRVHWASYAGKNFTDRQRIKRKAERWGKNYAALPRAERVAVLAALMSAEVSAQA